MLTDATTFGLGFCSSFGGWCVFCFYIFVEVNQAIKAVETLGGMHRSVSQPPRLDSTLERHTGSYEKQCSNGLQPPAGSRFPAIKIGRG